MYRSVDPQTENKIKAICSQMKVNFKIFKMQLEVLHFLQNENTEQPFYIVVESKNIGLKVVLMRNQRCLQIIVYNFSNGSDNQSVSDQSPSSEDESSSKIFTIRSLHVLKIFLKESSQASPEFKKLPNFAALNDEQVKANQLICCMIAMLNQNVDKHIRTIILDQLQEIKKATNGQQNDEKIFQQLKKNNMTARDALKIYSSQTQFYKLINNFLRAMTHSTELFYIQPFFKDLFSSISKLDESDKKEQRFWCFRGGFISQQQLQNLKQNVGSFVQNLSFMSTSRVKEVACEFVNNALLQIKVEVGPNKQRFSYGFADISKYSQFYSEREILFNPLNYFKILQITTYQSSKQFQEPKIFVTMDFSQKMIFQNSIKQSLDENLQIMQFFFSIQQKYRDQVKCQGDALLINFNKKHLKFGLQYWQKYCQLYEQKLTNCKDQSFFERESGYSEIESKYCKGLMKKSLILFEEGKIKQALELYKKLFNFMLNFQKHFQLKIQCLSRMADCLNLLLGSKGFSSSLLIYQKCSSQLLRIKVEGYDSIIQRLEIRKSLLEVLIEGSEESRNKCKKLVSSVFSNHKVLHKNTFYALTTMSAVLFFQKQYSEALTYYRKLAFIIYKTYGPRSKQHVVVLSFLASCIEKLGDVPAAIKIYRQCISKLAQLNDFRTAVLTDVLYNNSNALFLQGNFEQSFCVFLKCEKLYRCLLGNSDENYIKVLMSIAILLYRICLKYNLSIRILKYCKDQILRHFWKQYPLHLQIVNWICQIYQAQGKNKRALKILKLRQIQHSHTFTKVKPGCTKFKGKGKGEMVKQYLDFDNL